MSVQEWPRLDKTFDFREVTIGLYVLLGAYVPGLELFLHIYFL